MAKMPPMYDEAVLTQAICGIERLGAPIVEGL
jgi:hypothetical protein